MAPDMRARVPERATPSNRLALVLGLAAISLTLLVGWLAFQRGRSAVTQSYLESARGEARWYASVLELSVTNKFQPDVLSYLAENFTKRGGRYPQSALVVYDETGVVRMDSLHPERVGSAAGAAPLPDFAELLRRREDWAGFCSSPYDGRNCVAAFAFPKPHGEFVGLFVPEESVTRELDRASIPWLIGTLLVALVLMPLALLLLQRNYTQSLARLSATEASLRESEARLSTAIESLPCEFWIHGRDGRVLLQNAQAVRSAGPMQGRTLAECSVDAEQVRFWSVNFARALEGETFEFEHERDHGQGPRQFHAIVGPVRGEKGVLGVSVLELDFTERRQTEQALLMANRELDVHFENSPLGLIEWDPQMRVRRWSRGAEMLFGWKQEQAIGRSHSELRLMHPADAGRVERVIGELTGGAPQISFEIRNLAKDGRTLHCQWFNTTLIDAAGRPASLLSICQDVTENVRADAIERMHREVFAAMREQRERDDVLALLIRGLEELIPDSRGSILLREADSPRLRHSAAPSMAEAYVRAIDGLPIGPGPESGVCGKACHTGVPLIVSDTREQADLALFRPLLEQHAIRAIHSYPVLGADGVALGTFALYFREPRRVLESERGPLEEAVDLARVVIEYARAQRQQARMHQRLALLHDIGRQVLHTSSIDDLLQSALERMCASLGCLRASILLVDREPDGRILRFRLAAVSGAALGLQPPGSTFPSERFSAAELLAFERGESIEHADIGQLLQSHPQYLRLHQSGVRSIAQLPMTSSGRLVGTLNLSYSTSGLPPREDVDAGREAAFLLAVTIERQRLGEALRQHAFELEKSVRERTRELLEANEEMETYVQTVTHDLRAPLRAIQGFGQALVEDCPKELSPLGRTYVERMIASAERMDLLMRELLAYSRLGHVDLHLQGVDLGLIEHEAEVLIASELEHSAAQVLVSAPLGKVRGHSPTLVQVLANLLSNAAKFVPAGRKPEIRLRPEPRGARLRLWIEDNGIGVPAESRERIWGVFERLHGMDAYPGSGLGLAIVRRALARMHGTCGVESGSGAGSRFWIELDLPESSLSAGRAAAAPPAAE